jgi:hypothetical protein
VSLLRKRNDVTKRKRRGLRAYTVVRCPMAGHQVGWCRGLCEPVDDRGLCGRVAGHSLQGRTQRAIAIQRARRQAATMDGDSGAEQDS